MTQAAPAFAHIPYTVGIPLTLVEFIQEVTEAASGSLLPSYLCIGTFHLKCHFHVAFADNGPVAAARHE